jgi:hypothetical protein
MNTSHLAQCELPILENIQATESHQTETPIKQKSDKAQTRSRVCITLVMHRTEPTPLCSSNSHNYRGAKHSTIIDCRHRTVIFSKRRKVSTICDGDDTASLAPPQPLVPATPLRRLRRAPPPPALPSWVSAQDPWSTAKLGPQNPNRGFSCLLAACSRRYNAPRDPAVAPRSHAHAAEQQSHERRRTTRHRAVHALHPPLRGAAPAAVGSQSASHSQLSP